MGKMVHMQLRLNDKGLSAAVAIFANAGTTPYAAAYARFQRDGYEQYLQDDLIISEDWMTDEEHRICHVWDEAEEAAVAACCAGWPKRPDPGTVSDNLEIPMTPSEATQLDLARKALRQ